MFLSKSGEKAIRMQGFGVCYVLDMKQVACCSDFRNDDSVYGGLLASNPDDHRMIFYDSW